MTIDPVNRDPPMTAEEYRRAIEVFLIEAHHLCDDATDEELRSLPRFQKVIDEYLADFREDADAPARALRIAFAYFDEYLADKNSAAFSAGYAAYLIDWQQRSGWPSD